MSYHHWDSEQSCLSLRVDEAVIDLGALDKPAKWLTNETGGRMALFGSDTPGEHASGVRPVYAWVPSIGISSLITIEGEQFPLWNDDLLIGSLRGFKNGYSIFRVRLHDKSVQFVEHVRTGLPVRDLIQMKNGLIVIWDGKDNLQVVSAVSDVVTQCKSCHAISIYAAQDPDTFQGVKSGPNLYGVINRSVGGLDHYEYSAALESLGGRWTRERLDAFLKDPQATAPGTSMAFAGIEDPQTRQEVIDLIEALSN